MNVKDIWETEKKDNILVKIIWKKERFQNIKNKENEIISQTVVATGNMVKGFKVGDIVMLATPMKHPELLCDGNTSIVSCKSHEITCKV